MQDADHLAALAAANQVLRATDPTDLDRAVPSCPGWTVEDLVAHIAQVQRWATRIVARTAGREGRAPRRGAHRAGDHRLVRRGCRRAARDAHHGRPRPRGLRLRRAPPGCGGGSGARPTRRSCTPGTASTPPGRPTPSTPPSRSDGIDELLTEFLTPRLVDTTAFDPAGETHPRAHDRRRRRVAGADRPGSDRASPASTPRATSRCGVRPPTCCSRSSPGSGRTRRRPRCSAPPTSSIASSPTPTSDDRVRRQSFAPSASVVASIRGRGRIRAAGAHPLDVGDGVAELADPVGLVLTDEAHAPRQRLAAAAGHAGIDERVEHGPLVHAQAGHDRDALGREALGDARRSGRPRTPCGPTASRRRRRCAMRCSRVSSRNPLMRARRRHLPACARRRRRRYRASGSSPSTRISSRSAVHSGGPDEPRVGQPPGEPPLHLGHRPHSRRSSWVT